MYKASSQKGFTLIEMIVSLAIFTIVALVAIGALVRITDANKKSITLKTTINNLNFALESLSREMRVGGTYNCSAGISTIISPTGFTSRSCSNLRDSWTIAFKSSRKFIEGPTTCNLIFAYIYDKDNSTMQKGEQTSCSGSITEFNDLISRDIKITDTIIDVNVDSDKQPKAFFWFKGYSGAREKEKTEFEVQTSVSQRVGSN